MARDCCLVGIGDDKIAMLSVALRSANMPRIAVLTRLNVAELGKLKPEVIVCDIDVLEGDQLESIRQLRFVLPDCTIAVFSGKMHEHWAAVCHLAGANCLLAKESTAAEISDGIRSAVRSGCFTDPRFAVGQYVS